MPKAPTLPPEQQKYVVQKLYDAFECLTEREWDEAYVECVLYLRVLMETAKTALLSARTQQGQGKEAY